MTNNNRTMITAPEGSNFVDLYAHVYLLDVCIHCDEPRETETYQEYVDHFYANEWEGERYHAPKDLETWTYLRDTCLD